MNLQLLDISGVHPHIEMKVIKSDTPNSNAFQILNSIKKDRSTVR